MDPHPLHTNAGADRVDTLVVAHDGDLRTVARDPGNLLDFNDAVVHFRDLNLEEPLHEHRRRPANDDLRVGARVAFHFSNDRPEHIAFPVMIVRNLFVAGQDHFDAIVH